MNCNRAISGHLHAIFVPLVFAEQLATNVALLFVEYSPGAFQLVRRLDFLRQLAGGDHRVAFDLRGQLLLQCLVHRTFRRRRAAGAHDDVLKRLDTLLN